MRFFVDVNQIDIGNMKKVVLGLFMTLGMVSGGVQAQEVKLMSDADTLSYMLGVTNSDGLKDYAMKRMGIDEEYVADFIRGIQEGIGKSTKKELAYIAGVQIGQQASGDMFERISRQLPEGETLDKELFMAGFMASVRDSAMVSMTDAKAYVKSQLEYLQARAKRAKYAKNKAAGERFLAENAKKKGVKVTTSGLQYKVLTKGKGEVPNMTSTVKVHYRGMLIDGKEFDNSYNRFAPTSFKVTQVIKGWTEALLMMPVGSKWELYIPHDLAYGARKMGDDIEPFSALVFEIELLEIVE